MRGVVLSLAIVAGLALYTPQTAAGLIGSPTTVAAASLQQPDTPDLKIDVDLDNDDPVWYTNPLWLAIGGLGLLVLILIVVFAARGSGTTVIKE
jgi:hypothetical protein